MKTAFLLFAFLLLSLTVKAQEFTENQKQYLNTENILKNPGFENGRTGWTNLAGTFTTETAVKFKGKYSGKIVLSAQTMSLTQSSILNATQYADGVQGLAMVRIKSSVALKVCAIQAGVVSTSLCVDAPANNKWGLYKVPFILGATSNGISIASTGAVSGTVYVDDAFLGAVDLKQDINACNSASCETEFSAKISSAGVVSGENLDWINGSCTNANPRVCTFNTNLFTVTPNCSITIDNNEAIAHSEVIRAQSSSSISIYTGYGNFAAQQYATNIICQKQGADFTAAKQLSNGNTYSSTNADFWGRTYSPTITADTGALSNFTTTAVYGRQGNRLHVKGRITFTGASSAFTCPKIGLPESLTLAVSDSEILGDAVLLDSSANRYVKMDTNTLVGLTNSVRISYPVTNAGTNPQSLNYTCASVSDPVVIASGDYFDYSFEVPVNEWQQSNIIIGQFNGLESCADSYECTDTFSAKISAAGVVSAENVEWISGNASLASTSVYTIAFTSGLFTVVPNCTLTLKSTGAAGVARIDSVSESTIVVNTYNLSAANTASDFNLVCQKAGADYIGKTAKAVASDQSVRVPSTIGTVIIRTRVGQATETSDCTTSTCGLFRNIGFASVTRSSPGAYSATFSTAFKSIPFCWTNSTAVLNSKVCGAINTPTTISAGISCVIPNSTSADSFFDFYCMGEQ